MFQNPSLVQDLGATKRADGLRQRRDSRVQAARHRASVRITRPLVRFLGH